MGLDVRVTQRRKILWSEIRRERREALRAIPYGRLNRNPVYGRFILMPFASESTIEYAKKTAIASQYLPLRAKLWHNARVVLLEPEWLYKVSDSFHLPFSTLGWKAEIVGTLKVERLRRMIIANKRAAHIKRYCKMV